MNEVVLDQGSPEWLEYRKSKFNASETPVLFGCGFMNKEKLAKVKFEDEEIYQNAYMKAGVEAEPFIREMAEKIEDCKFTPVVGTWEKDERFSASLDGINEKGDLILECKNSKSEYKQVLEHQEPSLVYYYQVQHQLMVSGAEKCLFMVRDSESGDYEWCYVKRDEKIQDEIVKKWEEFVEDIKNDNLVGVIDENYLTICERLKQLNLDKKEIETKEKELKAFLQNEMSCKYGDFEKVSGCGVSISRVISTRTDYKSFLKDKNLVIPDKYNKTSTSYRFNISK